MKKIIALALALIMALSMASVAFAKATDAPTYNAGVEVEIVNGEITLDITLDPNAVVFYEITEA